MSRFFSLLIVLVFSLACLQADQNKVVLITGASRGVGLATAKYLASKGYTVYGTIRGPMALIYIENLHFLSVDLTSEESIHAAVQTVLQKEGHLDVLINNAGYAIVGPAELISVKEMQEQMQINFFAPIQFIQAALPSMRERKRGHIINISSTNAFSTPPFGSLYAASKAALESFSEALCVEIHPYNIAVSIVEPGLLKTRFSLLMGTRPLANHPYGKIMENLGKALQERIAHPSELPRAQEVEEVASFLCSVIEDPSPKLRYQTSEYAKEDIASKLSDLTGEIYLKHALK